MSVLVVFGIVFSSTGCRRKKDTIAKVYVRDASNNPVASVRVTLFGETTTGQVPDLTKTSTTNSTGEAIFLFNDVYQLGQAGVAVLNIEAELNGEVGEGIIKIEQETTSEETVFI